MASTANSDLSSLIRPSLIRTNVVRLPPGGALGYDLAVRFEGLSPGEVAALIDAAIKIEQKRTGDILTPTEYGNRFAALDLTEADK